MFHLKMTYLNNNLIACVDGKSQNSPPFMKRGVSLFVFIWWTSIYLLVFAVIGSLQLSDILIKEMDWTELLRRCCAIEPPVLMVWWRSRILARLEQSPLLILLAAAGFKINIRIYTYIALYCRWIEQCTNNLYRCTGEANTHNVCFCQAVAS